MKNKDKSMVAQELLNKLPENIADLYPKARKMFRHFNLYIGPTNSGKTYEATRALYNCKHGLYLGPLRLLAYEQYITLNKNKVICSLLTGEEQLIKENAVVQSSTVEMLDLNEIYDCIVLDEAQMLDDRDRGGKWTRVILGAQCQNINVCCAPEAEEAIIRLIKMCGDSYDIIRKERTVPLEKENKVFNFPEDIKPGDALIVFSRNQVHAIADELRNLNISSSIIYGNLPYDVRQNEANKFAEGKTNVLISTDAIGMGLNLPIKRVVFLEYEKFSSEGIRNISTMEAKQIAGRAGRMNLYNRGYWTCIDSEGMNYIKEQLKVSNNIRKIGLSFPEIALDSKYKLYDLLHAWQYEIKNPEGFFKENVLDKLELCKYAEKLIMDREVLWRLISVKFEIIKRDDYTGLYYEWVNIVNHTAEQLRNMTGIPYKPKYELIVHHKKLNDLEEMYQLCDMLYRYYEIFGFKEEQQEIQDKKLEISHEIMRIIQNKSKDIQLNFRYNNVWKNNKQQKRKVYGFT